MKLFQDMEENKLPLNIIVCNILIEGMHKVGNLVAPKDLFWKLSSKGLQPYVRTYTIIIYQWTS